MSVIFDVDEALLRPARRRAAAERTTLNEQLDGWLRRYALAEHRTETAMTTIAELQDKLCTEGRHFSRDDLNER